ncbi:16S rRNA (adenine(1518)-N(6)/adenine(1519)-N(6))-dimethyltransferase RsmA [Bacteroidota bacterium]
MKEIRPIKRFGQNYLVDKNIIRKLVDVFDPKDEENIVEIGPGHGSITEELFCRTGNVTAVEIDKRINEELKDKFPELILINKDFLKIELTELIPNKNSRIRLIGNIPFNITSQIIFKLIENRRLINDAVFIVQHEVAKRITAGRGSKDYGILSVVLNYLTDTKFIFKISPGVFRPKPKVNSAVIHIKFKDKIDDNIDEKLFIRLVKASFGNRRKTLKNSLSNSIFSDCDFDNSDFDLTRRAEELSTGEFLELTKFLSAHGYG